MDAREDGQRNDLLSEKQQVTWGWKARSGKALKVLMKP